MFFFMLVVQISYQLLIISFWIELDKLKKSCTTRAWANKHLNNLKILLSWLSLWGTKLWTTLRSINDVTEGITQESPRNHPWVVPKKVASLVWFHDFRLVLLPQGRALHSRRNHPGITHRFLLPISALPWVVVGSIHWNSNHFVYFSRNHPGIAH